MAAFLLDQIRLGLFLCENERRGGRAARAGGFAVDGKGFTIGRELPDLGGGRCDLSVRAVEGP